MLATTPETANSSTTVRRFVTGLSVKASAGVCAIGIRPRWKDSNAVFVHETLKAPILENSPRAEYKREHRTRADKDEKQQKQTRWEARLQSLAAASNQESREQPSGDPDVR